MKSELLNAIYKEKLEEAGEIIELHSEQICPFLCLTMLIEHEKMQRFTKERIANWIFERTHHKLGKFKLLFHSDKPDTNLLGELYHHIFATKNWWIKPQLELFG